jgi:hypothetical protein
MRYGRSENVEYEPTGMVIDKSGNVYVTGGSYRDRRYSFTTLKYDETGNRLWAAAWQPAQRERGCIIFSETLWVSSARNVYVAGESQCGENETAEMVLLAYDGNGNLKWPAPYRTAPDWWVCPVSMVTGQDGSVCVSAYEAPRIHGRGYEPSDILESMKKHVIITVRYDQNGKKLWDAKYKDALGRIIVPYHLLVDTEWNMIVVGAAYGDPLVIMYDADGREKWVREPKGPSALARLLAELNIQ